jgi:hypothetical protein
VLRSRLGQYFGEIDGDQGGVQLSCVIVRKRDAHVGRAIRVYRWYRVQLCRVQFDRTRAPIETGASNAAGELLRMLTEAPDIVRPQENEGLLSLVETERLATGRCSSSYPGVGKRWV